MCIVDGEKKVVADSLSQSDKQTRRAESGDKDNGKESTEAKEGKHTGFFPNDAPFDVEPQRDIVCLFFFVDSAFTARFVSSSCPVLSVGHRWFRSRGGRVSLSERCNV